MECGSRCAREQRRLFARHSTAFILLRRYNVSFYPNYSPRDKLCLFQTSLLALPPHRVVANLSRFSTRVSPADPTVNKFIPRCTSLHSKARLIFRGRKSGNANVYEAFEKNEQWPPSLRFAPRKIFPIQTRNNFFSPLFQLSGNWNWNVFAFDSLIDRLCHARGPAVVGKERHL